MAELKNWTGSVEEEEQEEEEKEEEGITNC